MLSARSKAAQPPRLRWYYTGRGVMEQEGLPQSDLMEDIGIPRPHQIHIPTLESKYRPMQTEGEGTEEKRVLSGESPSLSLPSCLANRPPFGTAANSNPRSGAAFQSLNLQGGARFSSQVWRVPSVARASQLGRSAMISSLITVLYSISRRKNLLTCRLTLH